MELAVDWCACLKAIAIGADMRQGAVSTVRKAGGARNAAEGVSECSTHTIGLPALQTSALRDAGYELDDANHIPAPVLASFTA